MLDDIHHGPRQAKLNGAHITRDWSSVLPGDWYQSDDCTSPVYYWENGPDGRPHAIRGQLLPMIDCKTTRILAFALHSEKNYNATVIRGLILRTHDSFGLPRNGLYFERGIWKSAKLLKGKGDEVSGEETERGLRDYVKFMHAELPRGKVIEGVLGILQRHMESIPGYVGRNEQTERFERIQKKLQLARAGHIDFASFLLHKDQWAAKLQELFDIYNCERQDGRLKGLSPREAWDTQFDFDRPLVRLQGPARRLLANHRRPLKVTKNGLCVEFGRDRHWFRNEETGRLIGQIVQVYFNPEDMSSVWIQRSVGDANAIVVPLAPTIPAMSATFADISAAKANCNAHNGPALTLYRDVAKHLPQNSPSQFRQNIVTQEFVDESRAISEQQAAIKESQITSQDQKKKVTRFERSLGKIAGSDGVSDERKLAAYELMKAAQNEHS